MSSQRRRVGPTGLKTNLNPLVTVTKRNSSPGRARSKPKSHCAGNAGLPPLNLYARVRFLLPIAHETAGAARIRHSLLPLFGGTKAKARAGHAARSRTRIPHAWRL